MLQLPDTEQWKADGRGSGPSERSVPPTPVNSTQDVMPSAWTGFPEHLPSSPVPVCAVLAFTVPLTFSLSFYFPISLFLPPHVHHKQ